MTAPYEAKFYSGFLVEVKWKAPVSTAGLLTKFILRAYNNEDPLIDPVEALVTNTSKRIGKCQMFVSEISKNSTVYHRVQRFQMWILLFFIHNYLG